MDEKLIVVMVGLPARGKSYITKKISNYLKWLDIPNMIFNVGNKRRRNFDSNQADFFNPNSEENVLIRENLALETLGELTEYLKNGGQVGIFDATNSTIKRRKIITEYIRRHLDLDYNIIFLESICNDQSIIERNVLLKLNGPDYKNCDNVLALNDFKKRLLNYESIYETVTTSEIKEKNVSFLKIIDIVNLKTFNIDGFLPIMLNSFLKNFQISKKRIYLTLKHIDFTYLLSETNLSILSSTPNQSFTDSILIPESCTLDQVHDIILTLESIQNDTIIQSNDEFLLNGILKYFNLFNYSNKSILNVIENNVIVINPNLYTVEYTRMKLGNSELSNTNEKPQLDVSTSQTDETSGCDPSDSPPIMTRSSSAISTSNLMTPIDTWDHKYSYKGLNVSELAMKLELLK